MKTIRRALSVAAVACITAQAGAGAFAQDNPRGHLEPSSAAMVVSSPSSAVTCRQGETILRSRGYTQIKAFDCGGIIFRYKVWKKNRQMVVLMNADSAGFVEIY